MKYGELKRESGIGHVRCFSCYSYHTKIIGCHVDDENRIKEKLCDWEDIVARLSLGLIWNMVSEMHDRYERRVQRRVKGMLSTIFRTISWKCA